MAKISVADLERFVCSKTIQCVTYKLKLYSYTCSTIRHVHVYIYVATYVPHTDQA